jgi:quercetin dioxygenase-like cupin family protein
MATDADGAEDAVEEGVEPAFGQEDDADAGEAGDEETPFFVEVWNDYDPSMRFVALFPVGEDQGAAASSVAYYIVEPGKHTGLHSDNVEEIAFVAEGEGEVFQMGLTSRLEAGKFVVFPPGLEHDIYALGGTALRLLSFFPTTEILSTFQQAVFPMGGNVISSRPPKPVVTELDPDNLPEDFPFSLEELGLAPAQQQRELTVTERLIGMKPPGEETSEPAPDEPEPAAETAEEPPAGE